ncbi:MAG: ribonuclease HII [Anaerolineae bacterium]|nr:ribonuclease HII [Thermoflexales bacterium]MDW8054425.1 ribonuclease HII [Anaerolineae bacterium]
MKLQPSLEHEQSLWREGYLCVAGLDEAGRGAWAGPVVAAAIVLPPDPEVALRLRGVTDSKQLKPPQRDSLRVRILEVAEDWSIGEASAEEIDALGIVAATRLAMRRALQKLKRAPQALVIDALTLPEVRLPQRAFPRADALSLSVAAASILAKTSRDALMAELDVQAPGYGFAQHKGYGTRHHAQQLRQLGASRWHRRSFKPVQHVLSALPSRVPCAMLNARSDEDATAGAAREVELGLP